MCSKSLPVDPFFVVDVVVVFFFSFRAVKVEGITYPSYSDVHLRFRSWCS